MKTLTAALIAILICSPVGSAVRNYTETPQWIVVRKVRRWKNAYKRYDHFSWEIN